MMKNILAVMIFGSAGAALTMLVKSNLVLPLLTVDDVDPGNPLRDGLHSQHSTRQRR